MRITTRLYRIQDIAMGYGVSLVTSPYPRNLITLYGVLWHLSDAPVSISALAEITRMDRASVRAELSKLDPAHFERGDDGIILTDAGRRKAYQMFVNFYRRIPENSRRLSKAYFSLDRHKLPPARALNAFLLAADAAIRRTGFPITQVLLMAYMRTSRRGFAWTVAALMEGTGLSYKRVHKQLQFMVSDGYAARTSGGYVITSKGRRANLAMYLAGLKVIPTATFKIVLDFSLFAISPPKALRKRLTQGNQRAADQEGVLAKTG